MKRYLAGAAAAVLWLLSLSASAHPLAPALLELKQTGPSSYDVLWRLSALQGSRRAPQPVLPAHCRSGPATLKQENGAAVASHWQLDCDHALAGDLITVEGLDSSGINVIVRLQQLNGDLQQSLLDARRPVFQVASPDQADAWSTLQNYLVLGAEHLWFGPDHLLFVLGLMLLVRRFTRLLLTLTAFTLGHSVTLSLATLGWINVNPALMEFGIALSLVVLARELLAKKMSVLGRHPGTMAFGFGLLHGLGFAGALADVGLPQNSIVTALLAFNVGIELGQLVVVAAVLALLYLWHKLRQAPATDPHGWRLMLPAYVIGGMASLWCLERFGPVLESMI